MSLPRRKSNSAPQSDTFWRQDPMMKSDDGANSDGDVEEQPPPPSAFVSDISSMIQKPMDDSIQVSTIPTSTQDNDDSISEKKRCYNGWGKGIIDDYKRTVKTHWKEEMTNFSLKTVAVSFFLFFACIAPAITFGAIYAKATYNWIGAIEMIAATSWCGIVYALIGGQPMMINGGTGPVLEFTEILYSMSVSTDVPFLTFNAWVGLWVCAYMIIAAFVNLNKILYYCTKFTDEIFSLLISTIFIINAIGSPFAPIGVVYYFFPNHKSHQVHAHDPDYNYLTVAIFSLMICIGTVQVSFFLRKIKFSPFLYHQAARNVVTDFAVVTSIVIWTVIASVSGIQTETLNVPDHFSPTYACCDATCDTNWPNDCPDQAEPYTRRPWLVDLGDLNGKGWVPLMAAGPALLAFILVFLDDGITWHLINAPAHKLTHGAAYNYDTVVIGIMIAINSMLGFPWLVAATVRSLNHIHAMAEKTPDGKIVSVKETRLSGLFIHLLCLASVFALNVLKLIPVPVLYGVFLFMGIVSLGTNTFWTRITMFFMQPARYPLEPFTVHMRPRRMHLYTLIQLGLFALLYVVKAIKTIAIAFPLIIALCIPFRLYVLPRIFTQEELVMIDSDDATIKAWLVEHPEEMTIHESEEAVALVPIVDEDEESTGGDKEQVELEPGAKDKEEHEGDQPMPLPDIESATKKRRKTRRKTVSCPPHMLFAEVIPPEASDVEITADQLTPLPDIETEAKKRRRTRKKTVSCPSHMLFAEVPVGATDVGISTIVEEEQEVFLPEATKLEDGEVAVPVQPPRIRKRTKSLSCPTHMLFNEANRQVKENYFFG